MAETDDDLQQEVNNAVSGGEATDTADNEEADTSVGGDQEDTDTSDAEEGDTVTDSSSASSATNSEAEDDEEDDDDDDDFAPPIQRPANGTQVPANFDIRTLPRDANGLIDPEAANKAIQDWADARANGALTGAQTEAKAREVLTNQWAKVVEKYPYLQKNKELSSLTRDMHLNSIQAMQNGTGRYLSPLAAAKKVNKMYQRAIKSGVTQATTKHTVERTATTERGGGKPANAAKDDYAKAAEMAKSKDPAVAKQGRMKIMSMRYNARHPKG